MGNTLTKPILAIVWEDGDAICMARVVGKNRQNATQASFSSITRKCFDISSDTPDTPITAGTKTLVIADTIYDTLQTDAAWTEDTTGYNFKDIVPAAVLSSGGHTYQVEYKLTAATGEIGWVVFSLTASGVLSS
jgi:hypothetical protein